MKFKLFACWALLLPGIMRTSPRNNQQSAATMLLNGGRLGDHLLLYWRAKYFCYIYNLPFYCPNFTYSNQLMLGKVEKKFYSGLRMKFDKVITLQNDQRPINSNNKTLYQIILSFRSKHGSGDNDPQFIAIMKQLIRPTTPMPKIEKVPGRLNVAIHVRRGSGPDRSFAQCQKKFPLKFPPDSFYLDALKKLIELTENQPIHLHIFTDAKNPESIVNIIKKEFNKDHYDVTYSFRQKNESAHKNHVITDLFNMADLDYFIRSGSGFANMAHKIGNHKIVIYPSIPVWHGGKLKIEKLGICDTRNQRSAAAK